MNTNETAQAVNILSDFCGCRDVPVLSRAALLNQYGFDQADVMVLFGGSILCGGDVLADAMRAGVAKKYAIVGGEGHTTQALRERMHAAFPAIETRNRSEAEVFAAYLKHRYGLISDFLECASTNCGNNITYLLKLLENAGITPPAPLSFVRMPLCSAGWMPVCGNMFLRMWKSLILPLTPLMWW